MDKHEYAWFLTQKARVQAARESSTLIYSEGDEKIGVEAGYYVFWYERQTPFHEPEYVHQYMGKGDAPTQVNIENWLTKYKRGR